MLPSVGQNWNYTKVQLLFPNKYGEDKIVMWPGGLHIEKLLLIILGVILEGMGWDAIIAEAEVATIGIAKSMLKVSHIVRTRNAYQVFLLALFILKKKAWDDFQEKDTSLMTFAEWVEESSSKSATFFYWELVADIVKKVLMFVRAHRQGNFFLYMQTLKELVPYFFALDHPNYARWMSAHIHDIQSQSESVLQEFSNVNWVI